MIDTLDLEEIAFCGNQTIVVIPRRCNTLHVYDVLKGVQLSKGVLLASPSRAHNPLIHWGHGESLLLATSFEIDGKITINIRDLRPTSNPPFLATQPFFVSPHDGAFSFSPVSFHASFLVTQGVVILNVRDSRILLRIWETDREYRIGSGHFSPDGRFFACATQTNEIHVWKNTSTSYVSWSNFVPQFPGLPGFAFSPSAISILTWGDYGIELLDNLLRPPSPKNTRNHCRTGDHLVTYSADWARIATARPRECVVTILDPLLDTPQRFINTNMRIREIKIFDNALFVADEHEVVSWDLGVGGTRRDAHGVKGATLDGILGTGWFKLSNNFSEIVIATEGTVFLYDIKTQKILNECTIGHMTQGFLNKPTVNNIWDIRFSPDGRQLWFLLGGIYPWVSGPHHCAMLNITEDWRSAEVTKELLEDGWSRDSRFPPPGYRIRVGSGWVEGSGGRKLLWLPPNWRTKRMTEAMWDGNFLALVNDRHPEPIIIEFRPQPLPRSCSTHSSSP